jgi:hypothetical protein
VSVHRWDVEPYVLADEIAEDGIDEVLDFFLPRQLHVERATLPDASLVLRSSRRTWTVGEGSECLVEGEASDLLLSPWGRGTPLPSPWAEIAFTP